MDKIDKHGFEPVSLLTVENGLLDIAIIPAMNQPDWIVPSGLIMSVDEYHERIWTYLWQNQEVVIYPLVTQTVTPNHIVVLEGNTDVHRIGLQINGEPQYKKVRISDVKDITLPDGYFESQVADASSIRYDRGYSIDPIQYIFQAVIIEAETYLVPDLDELSHRLVDLDG